MRRMNNHFQIWPGTVREVKGEGDVIRAILFDRDGTLIDFNPTWGACGDHVIRRMCDNDPERVQMVAAIAGFDLQTRTYAADSVVLTGSLADYGPQWADILGRPFDDAFTGEVDALLLEGCALSVTPFPGVIATLRHLAGCGLPMGIATNGTESSARKQIAAMSVDDCFSFVAGYDSGFGQKPGPGQIHAFADHCGVVPQQVALVGDSLHDMHAAKAAGARAIAVTTGTLGIDRLDPHADAVIDSLAELPGLLYGGRDLRP